MSLLVIQHLDAVFDGTEEIIAATQTFSDLPLDNARRSHGCERVLRPGLAQFRAAPAEDQLLHLRKELDLAHAAPAQLYVEIRRVQFRMAAMGVDLPLDRMDVGNRPIVEMPAPDIRLQIVEVGIASLCVARADARLDVRHALPVLTDAFVIAGRKLGRDCRAGRRRIRAKPQISAEHVAIGGALF